MSERLIKVALFGALGRMGRMVAEEIGGAEDLSLARAMEASGHKGIGTSLFGVEVTDDSVLPAGEADVAVDFTNPEAAVKHISICRETMTPIVVGTTGISEEGMELAREAADSIPVLISPNMSVGVNLLFRIVEETARVLGDFDVEISEIHHNLKKDSPSGTAARIAEIISSTRKESRIVHGRSGLVGPRNKDEIGVHSLRGGDVVGEHTVIFAGQGERLELTHRAHSRRTFARGTIRAVRFIVDRKPGLYTMADVLF